MAHYSDVRSFYQAAYDILSTESKTITLKQADEARVLLTVAARKHPNYATVRALGDFLYDAFPQLADDRSELDEIELAALSGSFVWHGFDSEEKLRRAIEIYPENSQAHYHLADKLFESKCYEEAAAEYKKAADLTLDEKQRPWQDRSMVVGNLGAARICARLNRVDEAKNHYLQFIKYMNPSADYHAEYGIFLAENKFYEEALPYLTTGIEKPFPGNQTINEFFRSNLIYYKGDCLKHLKRIDEAVLFMEEMSQRFSDQGIHLVNLTSLLIDQKNYEAAEKAGRQAIEKLPDHPIAYNNLAFALMDQKRYEEAEEMFRKGIDAATNRKLDSNDASLLYNNLGVCLMRRNPQNHEEARALFEKAIEIHPDAPNAHYHLAKIFNRTGHPGQALEQSELAREKAHAAGEAKFEVMAARYAGMLKHWHPELSGAQAAIAEFNNP